MKKNYKLITACIVLLSIMSFKLGAQALSGVYTINGANATNFPTGTNFQTFNAFATAINAGGVSGPVEVNVANGTFNEQVTFTQIAGMSPSKKVTINGNGSTLTFNGTSGAPHTILLNGTDYLTVNDLNIIGSNTTYAL